MLTEALARWVLVLHTALGVAAVGAATHLVLWSRGFLRGSFGRLAAVRRFAWIVLVLQILAFAAGNVMYPTYKVEVRTAYLENREALVAAQVAHADQLARIAAREAADAPTLTATGEIVRRAASAARWFDVKEHWIALGILAALALVFVLGFWDPRSGARELAPVVFGLSLVIAGTLWLGAVIGVLTASWRAV
ncbi:MAG TPA: hypothetical protein VHN14_00275 [Kofleriaceae bacterium]|nr:hypothetical protein [Kofleriaceae bacterium]